MVPMDWTVRTFTLALFLLFRNITVSRFRLANGRTRPAAPRGSGAMASPCYASPTRPTPTPPSPTCPQPDSNPSRRHSGKPLRMKARTRRRCDLRLRPRLSGRVLNPCLSAVRLIIQTQLAEHMVSRRLAQFIRQHLIAHRAREHHAADTLGDENKRLLPLGGMVCG